MLNEFLEQNKQVIEKLHKTSTLLRFCPIKIGPEEVHLGCSDDDIISRPLRQAYDHGYLISKSLQAQANLL